MGTRNLSCLVVDGEYAIAQYGQWDGYPSGQGLTILNFIRDHMDEARLKERLAARRMVASDEEWQALWAEVGVDYATTNYVTEAQSRAFKQRNPFIDRDLGGKIFERIQCSDDPVVLKNGLDFAGDGLFCEWAYVVDLDKRTFEVYTGFHKERAPAGQRFANLEVAGNGYGQVHFFCMFDLDDLPSDEEFLAQTESPEEDDE